MRPVSCVKPSRRTLDVHRAGRMTAMLTPYMISTAATEYTTVRMQGCWEGAMTSTRDHNATPTLLRSRSLRSRHVQPGTPVSWLLLQAQRSNISADNRDINFVTFELHSVDMVPTGSGRDANSTL